ncbi:MAG: hypothetical protein RIS88_650 [Pseudomonadota bacterium]|jgi:type IV pilus assembly protein PilP
MSLLARTLYTCRRAARAGGLPACLLACLVVAGCGDPGQESVQDWITQRRAQLRTDIPAVAEPRAYRPEPYGVAGSPDPFNSQKLTQALRRDLAVDATSALVRPEQARPRQALEAFPLDTMTLVGSLFRQGQPVALVRVDQFVHSVRVGAYLGQNFGKVIGISENQVLLREIVQDASGLWTERTVSLYLREGNK